jgi:hypothetical protein
MNWDALLNEINNFTTEDLKAEIEKLQSIITENGSKIMILTALLQSKGGIERQIGEQPSMKDIKEALIEIMVVQGKKMQRLTPVFNYLRYNKGFVVDTTLAYTTRRELIKEGFLKTDNEGNLTINN